MYQGRVVSSKSTTRALHRMSRPMITVLCLSYDEACGRVYWTANHSTGQSGPLGFPCPAEYVDTPDTSQEVSSVLGGTSSRGPQQIHSEQTHCTNTVGFSVW